MSILFTVHYKKTLIGRCDAKCYHSKTKNCDCICRGAFHNMPFNSAVRKLRKIKAVIKGTYPEKDGWKVRCF